MSQVQSTRDKATSYLTDMSQRNLEATLSYFADEVDWHVPGNSERASWLGKRRSKSEIRDFFTTLWAETVPLEANVQSLMSEGDEAVVIGHFSTRMTKTDRTFHSPFSLYIQFKGSLITSYRLLEDSFGLSEILDPNPKA